MLSDCEYRLIRDQKSLLQLRDELAACGCFAFDTEFVGEDSYRPQVCLIQVATDDICALIDPLGGLDAGPIWEMIADKNIQVAVHAGSEDLALCWKEIGQSPANVVDLQIGGGLMGLGYPTSLVRLAKATIGAKLHKSQTLTDWRKRPLAEAQLRYAVEDVIHLPAIHRHMHQRLTALGRAEWLIEESAKLCAADSRTARGHKRLRKIRGVNSLRPQQLAILDAIMAERDELARKHDRPPRTILRDHLVVELARHGWTTVEKMRSLRGLNLANADLKRIAAAIEKAKTMPPEDWPEPAADEPTLTEDALLGLIGTVLLDFCQREGIAYSLLTNKEDLRCFVRSYHDPTVEASTVALRNGWRGKAVGRLLERILSGQGSIRVDPARRRLVVE